MSFKNPKTWFTDIESIVSLSMWCPFSYSDKFDFEIALSLAKKRIGDLLRAAMWPGPVSLLITKLLFLATE